ncbi:hypothetical protein BC829DRAFT_89574 [Chytridium lagenaria]|nr:hypothetical protein BC829DRAFT_89574 [Chytridium lagenaria]
MTNMAGLAVSEKVGGMMKSDDRAVFKVVMPMRPTLSVDTRPPPVAVLNKEISKGDLPTPLTPTTRKGSPKRQQKKAQDDCDLAPGEEWRCVECGVREHETPLKRKGPDKKRNLCNACYVRWRVRAERAERGSARPVLSDSGAYGSTGAMANRAFPPQHNSQAKIEIPASPITGKYSTQGTHTITHPNTVYHNQNSNQNNHSVNSRASSFFLGRQGSAMSMGQSRGSSMVDMFGASVGESPSSASMAAALAVQVAAAEAAGFNGGMSSWTSYMLAAGASALDDAVRLGRRW